MCPNKGGGGGGDLSMGFLWLGKRGQIERVFSWLNRPPPLEPPLKLTLPGMYLAQS